MTEHGNSSKKIFGIPIVSLEDVNFAMRVLLADMPLAMVRERIGPNNLKQFTMCDVCWFKGNEKAVKEGGTVFPFPAPNAHQDRASRGGNV